MACPELRSIFIEEVSKIKEERVGLLLSGGVGSSALLFALLAIKKKVTAYCFTLEGKVSSDFSRAGQTARIFGIDFVPVFLPTDLEQLKRDMLFLVSTGVVRKKTDFECGWPMLYAYASIRENAIISGMGDDCHFCISKKRSFALCS